MKIPRIVLFLPLLPALCLGSGRSKVSLYHFCSDQVDGETVYKVNSVRIQHYLRLCRDVDAYVECILKHRFKDVEPKNILIETFERYFPSKYDLKRAAYHFCSLHLPTVYKAFTDFGVKSCADSVDEDKCRREYVSMKKLEVLRKAIDNENMDQITNTSCDIQAPLINCLQTQYYRCSKNYEEIRNYELAQLGGECLVSHNLHSPLATVQLCAKNSQATNKKVDSYGITTLAIILILQFAPLDSIL